MRIGDRVKVKHTTIEGVVLDLRPNASDPTVTTVQIQDDSNGAKLWFIDDELELIKPHWTQPNQQVYTKTYTIPTSGTYAMKMFWDDDIGDIKITPQGDPFESYKENKCECGVTTVHGSSATKEMHSNWCQLAK